MDPALSNNRRKKILFVAEAVTLAHVARPFSLAQTLPHEQFEVVLASHPRFRSLFVSPGFRQVDIDSIDGKRFLGRLAKGQPPYDRNILEGYLEEELRLLETEAPDLVVGDFRLTLAISCRKKKIPYLAIANAYWSPFADSHYPVPEHPSTRIIGVPLAERLFNRIAPLVFSLHTGPFNALCRRHGLPGVGADLRRCYTEADHTLYADIPALVPVRDAPVTHHYLGPIPWAPAVELPPWWEEALAGDNLIYVTPGSSGMQAMLPEIVAVATKLPVTVLVATASKTEFADLPPNVFLAPYLPGNLAARHASVVVCNGGSPTTYQALQEGVPVIGIPSNLDQYLNMKHVQASGAGLVLRSGKLRGQALAHGIRQVLEREQYRKAALALKRELEKWNAGERFLELIRQL